MISDAPCSTKATCEDDNEVTVYHLVRQLRTPLGIIPFVGAGMSAHYGFPQWGDVLRSAARVEGPAMVAKVDALLEAGEFEDAAEALRAHGEDEFQRRIEKEYGRSLDSSETRDGPLSLLPLLCSGPVITTNFDHVLEEIFRACGAPFDERVLGPDPDRILKAMHGSTRVLIKMHGDCEDRRARSFTKREYDLHYGEKRSGMSSLVRLMFTSRPLLFVGCSLHTDRTVNILRALHDELAALTHYAIVEAPHDPALFQARRRSLLDMGISPLWFEQGEFEQVGQLLERLVFGMSVRSLPRMPTATPTNEGTLRPRAPRRVFGAREKAAIERPRSPNGHLDRVAHAVLEGRVTFVLGVGAHLGAFQAASHFYQQLADRFGVPTVLGNDRAAVARHIADRFGRRVLWEAVRNLADKLVEASVVHQFLAGLPAFLRSRQRRAVASQVIFTTNQDIVLEQAFEEAGEPFHLLYYCGDGDYEGLFIHRDTQGARNVIDKPENIRALSPASIIIKLNGGIAYPSADAWPETAVIARGDYARLASRIPDGLPAVVRRAISDRSLLCLGHGLMELDVEELIRVCAGPQRTTKSWAIQWPRANADYWAQCGLEVCEYDLAQYVPDLEAVLLAAVPRRAQEPPLPAAADLERPPPPASGSLERGAPATAAPERRPIALD
jgi:Arc/MetJ-type ribon-helix-helix transcriptional regulator